LFFIKIVEFLLIFIKYELFFKKAEAAAESLKRIFPSINAKGIHLEIPMPGHFISNEEQVDYLL